MNYQKKEKPLAQSYKLLILWFMGLFLGAGVFSMVINSFQPEINSKITSLSWLFLVCLFIVSLLAMIYKTERIYYINYISYKEAAQMTSNQRKKFAREHLVLFIKGTAVFAAFSVASYLMDFAEIVDFLVFLGIIIIAAVKSISIQMR